MTDKAESIRSVTGMNDVFPDAGRGWKLLEEKSRRVFGSFGFQEIRTNILEPTRLFSRGVGEATDIVEKEMYSFRDKSDEDLTMRPEGTAGVVRAFIEHKLYANDRRWKLWYYGPMYRYERPQKGRYRQFYQVGAEILGGSEPSIDVTLITLVDSLLRELGVRDKVTLELSTLGDTESRLAFRKSIQDHFRPKISGFCADCQRRIEANPLRILDCKVDAEKTKDAPVGLDSLNEVSRTHFEAVKAGLAAAGVNFTVNPRIVRGLDYYCHTVFEFVTTHLGSQGTVAAGGRYDGLVEELGGPPTPGVGFAAGAERLIGLITAGEAEQQILPLPPDLFLVAIGDRAKADVAKRMLDLCRGGIRAEIDYEAKSIKSQMRYADKLKAKYVVVIGDSELDSGRAKLKTMADGTEREIELARLADALSA